MQPFAMDGYKDDFVRVPGFYRRWELPNVLDLDVEYVLEAAGAMSDGTELLFLFQRHRPTTAKKEGK